MIRHAALVLMIGLLASCVTNPFARPATDWSIASKTIDVVPNDIIRLVTPFPEPRIITASTVEIQRSQNVLYLLVDSDQPITMFVTDADNEAASINLTLVPKPGGVREVDFIEMANKTIKPAAAKKIANQVNPKRKSLRRDPDDHGDDDYSDDQSSSWQ